MRKLSLSPGADAEDLWPDSIWATAVSKLGSEAMKFTLNCLYTRRRG